MSKLNLQKIDLFTVTGANPSNNYSNNPNLNGDAIVNMVNAYGIRVVGVIDGAKAPYEYSVQGIPNDAYASNLMKTLVEEYFSVMRDITLWEDVFDSVINSYRMAFDVVRLGLPEFEREDYRYFNAACAFALAIIDEKSGKAVVLQATDCYAVLSKAGQLKNMSFYDEKALVNSGRLNHSKLLSDWLAEGKTLEEAKKLENARVLQNRKCIYNKCDSTNNMGMAVMNGDMDLLDCMQMDVMDLSSMNAPSLVLMSDGYMCKHGDILKSAQGALDKGVGQFFTKDIVPLWGNTEKDVMTDVSCITIQY